jgi:hypothetical protein
LEILWRRLQNLKFFLLDNWCGELLKADPMKFKNKRIELDWGKLLGFSQVKRAQGDLKSTSAKGLIEAKIGLKAGIKKQL